MLKSKEFIESSDSDESNVSDKKESVGDKETIKVKTTTSKTKSTTSKDSPAKRIKTDDNEAPAIAGPNGERLYEIGKLRYISVGQYKGKTYINIREYYDDHGVQKPGRKGISLTVDQWEKLKTLVDQVDKELKKSK